MNKVIAQVNNIDDFKAIYHGYIFHMLQIVPALPGNREKAGILLHYIAAGPEPIDFVCYSCYFNNWPKEVVPSVSKNIVVGKCLPGINQSRNIEAYLRGIELPKWNEAEIYDATEFFKKELEELAS